VLEVGDLIAHIRGGDRDLESGDGRDGHAWNAFADACGGTSILLLFPTKHCGGFLFQFFWCGGECRKMRGASVRTRKMRNSRECMAGHSRVTLGHLRDSQMQIKKTRGFLVFLIFYEFSECLV
jgi:hypothetical protein